MDNRKLGLSLLLEETMKDVSKGRKNVLWCLWKRNNFTWASVEEKLKIF